VPLVHQAVASFVPYDAVSEAAIRFRRVIAEQAKNKEGGPYFRNGSIVAEGIHRSLASLAVPFHRLPQGDPDDLIVYHVSTDSEIAPWLEERPETVAVYYHNLTPSYFFAPYDPASARRLEKAKFQLQRLVRIAKAAAAPSEFSLQELRQAGFTNMHKVSYPVFPLSGPPSLPRVLRPTAGTVADPVEILFVGRITPNKAQEQLLRLTALLRKQGIECNLALVGGVHLHLYRRYLGELSARLGLGEDPFVGNVSPKELSKRYLKATFFVSFSRHEGFFVPAVEAMQRGLPLVALSRGAVEETVGYGGVLVPEDDIGVVAASILEILDSSGVYTQLSSAGIERAQSLCDSDSLAVSLMGFLESSAG
jgi:glycosyltransferase involved in cell wall biosynthesis